MQRESYAYAFSEKNIHNRQVQQRIRGLCNYDIDDEIGI